MTLKNSVGRWGLVSQLFHWFVVVLIVVMAYLGLTMTDLQNSPHKIRVYALHKSIGLAILALVALRLAWRAYAGAPRAQPGMPQWQRRGAALTHGVLYGLLFAVPLTGWLQNSAAGFPLRWFNLFRIPPIAARDEALHSVARAAHEVLFWTLIVLALVHAAAAIHHHLVLRDDTLSRMLPSNWLRIRARHPETPHA